MPIQTVICEGDFIEPGSGRESRRGMVSVPHVRQIIIIDPAGQSQDIAGGDALLEIDCLQPCVTIRDGDGPLTTIEGFPLQICVALDADKLAKSDDDWQFHVKRFVQRVYPIPSGVPIALTVYALGWRPEDAPGNMGLAVGRNHGGFQPEGFGGHGRVLVLEVQREHRGIRACQTARNRVGKFRATPDRIFANRTDCKAVCSTNSASEQNLQTARLKV
ncbi:MAG: hypothetical protein U1D30_09300 [Planctomycetota bacterium]